MNTALSAVAKQIQDFKAQSLASLMATLTPAQAVARVGGNLTGSAAASLQSAEAAIQAVILEIQPGGRVLLQVAGGFVEAELPPELLRAAALNPGLLKPGTQISLPASIPARSVPPPATLVAVSGHMEGSSVGPAPPLPNPFPAGSLGAAIARLTGIVFPAGEIEADGQLPLQPHQLAMRAGVGSPALPPTLAGAALQAASQQQPLAAALAQIFSLGAGGTTSLQPEVTSIIKLLQGGRATPDTIKTSEGLQSAVSRSGLFLEAHLAKAAPQQPVLPDLKSLLIHLKSLTGQKEEQAGNAAPAKADIAPHQPTLPRTQLTATQAPPDLARAVEGAVERLKLMQLVSLPDHPEITVTDDRAQPMRLALSIPLATQGLDRPHTAVLGMMIEHQPQPQETTPYEAEADGSNEGEPFPWKVRIALDLEETGPVQAEIALRGQTIAVTLWAEHTSMAKRARSEIGTLHDALSQAAFDVARLEVKDGRPQGKVPRATPMLDRRT
jgi:hypothetical protein